MVRILWIEEEAKTSLLHFKIPLVRAGYIVDIAESVTEAIELLKEIKYDILIIDLLLPEERKFRKMPDYPGIELAKVAKKEFNIDTNKMMILTVVKDKGVHERIRKLGVKKIVVKSLMDVDDLKKNVDELLQTD